MDNTVKRLLQPKDPRLHSLSDGGDTLHVHLPQQNIGETTEACELGLPEGHALRTARAGTDRHPGQQSSGELGREESELLLGAWSGRRVPRHAVGVTLCISQDELVVVALSERRDGECLVGIQQGLVVAQRKLEVTLHVGKDVVVGAKETLPPADQEEVCLLARRSRLLLLMQRPDVLLAVLVDERDGLELVRPGKGTGCPEVGVGREAEANVRSAGVLVREATLTGTALGRLRSAAVGT